MNERIESELGEAVDMVRDTIERAYDAGLKDGKLVGSESARKRIAAKLREAARAMLRHDAQAVVLGLADSIERGDQ